MVFFLNFFQLGKVVSLTLNNFSVKASIQARQYQFIPVIVLSLRFKINFYIRLFKIYQHKPQQVTIWRDNMFQTYSEVTGSFLSNNRIFIFSIAGWVAVFVYYSIATLFQLRDETVVTKFHVANQIWVNCCAKIVYYRDLTK